MTGDIPEINLNLTCTEVKADVRKLRTKVKVTYGKPIVRISHETRKLMKMNLFQYWLWKRYMRKVLSNGK